MTSKQMKFDIAAQAEFKKGVDKLASAVAVTMGPSGHNVVIEKSYGGPSVTKDGVSVAKEIELEGMTMGILGFGGTGRGMARRAEAFGMNVIAVDEFPSPGAHGVDEVWPIDRLDDLLGQADVVAVCCPLTPSSQ